MVPKVIPALSLNQIIVVDGMARGNKVNARLMVQWIPIDYEPKISP
jgi:hypothetical protein